MGRMFFFVLFSFPIEHQSIRVAIKLYISELGSPLWVPTALIDKITTVYAQ
jgi:hypothetical protein